MFFFGGLLLGIYLILENKKNKKIFKTVAVSLFVLMIISDLVSKSDCETALISWFKDGCI